MRIETEDGQFGMGEASPMQGGRASLVIIAADMAPLLIGKDILDHAVLLDTLYHTCIKLGPEGATTAALAALDIALWDLKGKLLGQPSCKLPIHLSFCPTIVLLFCTQRSRALGRRASSGTDQLALV
ncbi:MAG: mandelate racemase/muconate lactonizing enzyme family protein [Devosia sp.]|nr:mandelate racemase/muconate lactonizing enzyme family protein [Devosia sp.]